MKFELNIDYKDICEQIDHITNINHDTNVGCLEGPLNLLEEIQMQIENSLPENFWDIIEAKLPNYSSRDDVLENDILKRHTDGESIDKEDYAWLKENNYLDINNAKIALIKSDTILYFETVNM